MDPTKAGNFLENIPVSGYERIDEEKRKASILIPLLQEEEDICILFEVRSRSVHQPGEICFPGGHVEEGESPLEAAVREVCEELQIGESQISTVHPVSYSVRGSGMTVYCHAAELKDYKSTYDPEETDHVFSIPLKQLKAMQPEVYRTRHVTVPEEAFPLQLIPQGRNYKWGDTETPVYFYRTEYGVIWGLTAFFLHDFLQRI